MTRLVVLTPSHEPDVLFAADLCASVARCTGPEVVHRLLVPRADVPLFSLLSAGRTEVVAQEDVLPRHLVTAARGWSLNLRRPWPPVRGWVKQQLVKLAAAAQADAPVLVVDSDVALVRPVDGTTFVGPDGPLLYRKPDAVHAGMKRHLLWHASARRLLGLPPASGLPLPDYITNPVPWDPALVRGLLARLQAQSGRHWADVLGGQLQLSECVLYGVYAEHAAQVPPSCWTESDSTLHHWETTPLAEQEATRFGRSLRPSDIAVHVSSRSGTPLNVRRAALAAAAEVAEATERG